MPLAAYSWQRFADATGAGEVSFESWPAFAASQVADLAQLLIGYGLTE